MNLKYTTEPGLIRHLLGGLLVGFIVLVGLMLIGDLRKVSTQVLEFHWLYFPVVLILTLFNYTLRFYKWHFYLGQVGVKGFPIKESARLFIAGFPLAVTPGKAGEIFKAFWLQKKTGTPISIGAAVVVAERVSDGLAVLLLSTASVIAYPRYWLVFASVLAGLIGFIALTQSRGLLYKLLDWGSHRRLLQKFSCQVRNFVDGSYQVFRPKAVLLAVCLGFISWLGEGIGFYLILLGLGVPAGLETLGNAVFILSFSTIIGAVSTLPGGLVAAEVSLMGMLVILMRLDQTSATAATLLIRMATLWFGVSLGLIIWAISPDLMGIKANQDPLQTSPSHHIGTTS